MPSFELCLFGLINTDSKIPNRIKEALAFASLLARRRILINWKSPYPPKTSQWLCDLMLFLKLEKIKFSSRKTSVKFHRTWDPMIAYFEKLKSLPTN